MQFFKYDAAPGDKRINRKEIVEWSEPGPQPERMEYNLSKNNGRSHGKQDKGNGRYCWRLKKSGMVNIFGMPVHRQRTWLIQVCKPVKIE